MAREIIDPLLISKPKLDNSGNLVAIASSDCIAYASDVPRSPVSGEPMQIVLCGTHKGPEFKIWVHLKDRLAIPYRE